ncbi:MAG: cyclodeaminase/cyclohydrolase family protein [Marinilabiliales bacterium]|nr:cyclodeaminase/cyclohydrolase family protein [Marinilabiliales bacterium]
MRHSPLMVANLTIPKKQYRTVRDEMTGIAEKAQALKDRLLLQVDDDTDAFNEYFTAMKMPKNTPEEKKSREEAMERASPAKRSVSW